MLYKDKKMFFKLKAKYMNKKIRTMFGVFTNIGQVTVFEFLLSNLNTLTMSYHHTRDVAERMHEETGIPASSQFRHLKHLCDRGVLHRGVKGVYFVNREWLDFE